MHSESASNSRGWPGPEPGKCVVNPFLRRQERNVAIYFPLRPGHKLAHLGLVARILSRPGAGGEDPGPANQRALSKPRWKTLGWRAKRPRLLRRTGLENIINPRRASAVRHPRHRRRHKWNLVVAREDNEGNLVVGTRGAGVYWFDAADNCRHIDRRRLVARAGAFALFGIGTGHYTYRSSLRIKEVRPRMRPRRSASCVELLKKFLKLLVHRKRADYLSS